MPALTDVSFVCVCMCVCVCVCVCVCACVRVCGGGGGGGAMRFAGAVYLQGTFAEHCVWVSKAGDMDWLYRNGFFGKG